MTSASREHFLILGAGSWGSALAIYLARQHHSVVLWTHNQKAAQNLQSKKENERYLPGISFPSSIIIEHDIAQAFLQAGNDATVFVMVPSEAFLDIITIIKPFLKPKMGILWGTKGLSQQGELLHEICKQHCPNHPLGVLSGPSFALEVAKGLPTAVSIATESQAFGEQMVSAFHSQVFRVYLSEDLIGVQLGGTIKNVLAIAVGMSDGLGYGANARAALITRGLAELCRLAMKMGAHMPTLMGLSGVGDMVLTCTDNQSRNRRFGLALGEGKTILEAESTIGQVVEGKKNAKQVLGLAAKHQVEMPICQQVYAVIYESITPQQAVQNLLTRSPKNESFT
jgi:glycerol-3-phosphate dehydrogenase (NAD(P)+)